MESILSIQEEVYPLKSRRQKSLSYQSNINNVKINTLNSRIYTFSVFYQDVRKMIAQRSIYILGLINLILAAIAIICVIQAEDDPEYFSLIYITVTIFIFYMGTIIFIIILQIIQTYQEQNKKMSSSSSIQTPLLTPILKDRSNPVLVESMTAKTQPKTSLSRSQTLPLTSASNNTPHRLSNSLLSPRTKDYKQLTAMPSSHLELLPKYHQSLVNMQPNYHSFTMAKSDQSCDKYTKMMNSESNTRLSTLIKPIPFAYHGSTKTTKTKIQFLD